MSSISDEVLSLFEPDKNLVIDENEPSCSICLNTHQEPVFVECCNKVFCNECLQFWLRTSNSCPMCRTSPVRIKFNTEGEVLYALSETIEDNNLWKSNMSTIFHHVMVSDSNELRNDDFLIKVLKFLLANGADVTYTYKGKTPVYWALRKKPSLEVIKFLVVAGAMIDTGDELYAKKAMGNRSPIHEFLVQSFHDIWNPSFSWDDILEILESIN